MPGPKDKPILDRRGFFANLFERVASPLARMAEEGLGRLDKAVGPALSPGGEALRPPGALPEEEFFRTCIRSGQCVRACPVKAIKAFDSKDPSRKGLPGIQPETQACVICDDLSCMKACPSGALKLAPRESIQMGLAVVSFNVCLRSDGGDCRLCVDKCPIGAAAIGLDRDGIVTVKREGCVGCGVCAMVCPSQPRAISILPPGAPSPYVAAHA